MLTQLTANVTSLMYCPKLPPNTLSCSIMATVASPVKPGSVQIDRSGVSHVIASPTSPSSLFFTTTTTTTCEHRRVRPVVFDPPERGVGLEDLWAAFSVPVELSAGPLVKGKAAPGPGRLGVGRDRHQPDTVDGVAVQAHGKVQRLLEEAHTPCQQSREQSGVSEPSIDRSSIVAHTHPISKRRAALATTPFALGSGTAQTSLRWSSE